MHKRWVEAIVSEMKLERACEIAQAAVECGTDMLGAGSNLLYYSGTKYVIPAFKKIAGEIPVVANMKAHDGCTYFADLGKRCGADYVTYTAVDNQWGMRQAVVGRDLYGVKVIGDMVCASVGELPFLAKSVENQGADLVCVNYGYDQRRYNGSGLRSYSLIRNGADGVAAVKRTVSQIPVGCVVYSLAEAEDALHQGADWLAVCGDVVEKGAQDSYATLRRIIEMAHA